MSNQRWSSAKGSLLELRYPCKTFECWPGLDGICGPMLSITAFENDSLAKNDNLPQKLRQVYASRAKLEMSVCFTWQVEKAGLFRQMQLFVIWPLHVALLPAILTKATYMYQPFFVLQTLKRKKRIPDNLTLFIAVFRGGISITQCVDNSHLLTCASEDKLLPLTLLVI